MLPFFSSFFTLQQLSYCCRFLSNITLHSSLFTLHSFLTSLFSYVFHFSLLSSLLSSLSTFSHSFPTPSTSSFLSSARPRLSPQNHRSETNKFCERNGILLLHVVVVIYFSFSPHAIKIYGSEEVGSDGTVNASNI